MNAPHLRWPMLLERPVAQGDGAGGMLPGWQELGQVWVARHSLTARDVAGEELRRGAAIYQIVLRRAPFGLAGLPVPGWRFGEAARRFRILAVQDLAQAEGYLACRCLEEGEA